MMSKTYKAAALAALALSTPAFALQSDSKQPIQIEADKGSLDQTNQTTTFSGNVIIRQGTLHLQAATVNVSRNSKGEQFMQAFGSPVKFSQTLDDDKGIVNGHADKAEYSSATGIVKLTGNAKVQRGGDVAQGAVITYNMRTEVYNILGGGKATAKAGTKSGRVSVVIQPSSTQSSKKK